MEIRVKIKNLFSSFPMQTKKKWKFYKSIRPSHIRFYLRLLYAWNHIHFEHRQQQSAILTTTQVFFLVFISKELIENVCRGNERQKWVPKFSADSVFLPIVHFLNKRTSVLENCVIQSAQIVNCKLGHYRQTGTKFV